MSGKKRKAEKTCRQYLLALMDMLELGAASLVMQK